MKSWRHRCNSDEVLEASLQGDKRQAKFKQIVEVAKGQGVD